MWAVLIWANTTEADVHREKLECDDWIHHRCYKSIRKRVLMPPTTVLLLQSLTYLLGVCVHRSQRKRELLWHSLCSASTTTGCFPSSCSWKHVKSKMSQIGRMENIRKRHKAKKPQLPFSWGFGGVTVRCVYSKTTCIYHQSQQQTHKK